jgi:hypothetical protein
VVLAGFLRWRLSTFDLQSLADVIQLLVLVNAVLRWRELYYAFSEFQEPPGFDLRLPFPNTLSHVKLNALPIDPALSHEGVFLCRKKQ